MATLRSMTAFGCSTLSSKEGTFTIEMQSLNRRFLEINFSLPKVFASFELPLRKEISPYLGRGAVHLYIKFERASGAEAEIRVDLGLAQALKTAWEKVASTLEIKEEVTLSLLSQNPNLFNYNEGSKNDEEYLAILSKLSLEALEKMNKMREEEGAVLAKVFLGHLDFIQQRALLVGKRREHATDEYREKLLAKITTLLPTVLSEDERVLKEIALFAERVDITEELVRLSSHIEKARAIITTPLEGYKESKGKLLDFLAQEILREVNTIASKSSDKEIIHFAVEMKGEIEKIKEQSQNIE